MIQVKGHRLIYDSERYQKISNLIEYDGPLLSHFKDENNNDYIYYWVDNSETHNRWLIWRCKLKSILKYLSGTITLRDLLICESLGDIIISDIDENINYDNSIYTTIDNLPKEYLPAENTFYLLEPPKYYLQAIENENRLFQYIKDLYSKSYTWKLKNSTSEFGNTLSIDSIQQFLKGISQSLKAFEKHDLFESFKSEMSGDKLNRIAREVVSSKQNRMLNVVHHSFEITISLDYLHIEDTAIKQWRDTLMQRFEKSVVQIDYSSPFAISKLKEVFPDSESLHKIIDPYLSSMSIPNTYMSAWPTGNESKGIIYKDINNDVKEYVKPHQNIDSAFEYAKTQLNKLVWESREGQDISKMSIRQLLRNVIESSKVTEANGLIDPTNIRMPNINVYKPIPYKYSVGEELFGNKGTIDELMIEVTGADKSEIEERLISELKHKIADFVKNSETFSEPQATFLLSHITISTLNN